jgi:hypothetical protein
MTFDGIKDPAAHFLDEDPSHTSFMRQRLNSGRILSQYDNNETLTLESCADDIEMEFDTVEVSKKTQQQGKGFLFLAVALGMMCFSSILDTRN